MSTITEKWALLKHFFVFLLDSHKLILLLNDQYSNSIQVRKHVHIHAPKPRDGFKYGIQKMARSEKLAFSAYGMGFGSGVRDFCFC